MLFAVLLAAVASVTGTVSTGGAAPGVTVTLRSGSTILTQITDVHGGYAFHNLPLGHYDVTYELQGLPPETRSINVRGGGNALPPVEIAETLTTGCSRACQEEPPATRFDVPTCDDYELDTALIAAAKRGDRSAVELLQQRYAAAFTYAEHYRIAAALLGRMRDDSAIWNELEEHAERLIAVDANEKKLRTYAREHGYDSEEYLGVAWDAFVATFEDRRARPLLLRALASDDDGLAEAGLLAFAEKPGDAPLAEIDAAVTRHPELASSLAYFDSDAVEAMAMKYLKDDSERAEYRRVRAEAKAAPSP